MDRARLIDALNRALAGEYAAVIQYNQAALVLTGPQREVFADLFREESGEALNHARDVGDWIVGYGGVPVVEPAPVRQTTDLEEMLEQAIELEQKVLSHYQEALGHVGDGAEDTGLRNYLEDMCETELRDLLEFKKLAGRLGVEFEEGDEGATAAASG